MALLQANPFTTSYLPIVFMVSMSAATGLGILVLSWLVSGRRSSAGDTVYECGLDPMDEPNKRFRVDFYVVAMLFILFDVEIALLIPWAIYYAGVADTAGLRWFAFADFLVFMAILGAGYVYLYKAGVFDWAQGRRKRYEAATRRRRAA